MSKIKETIKECLSTVIFCAAMGILLGVYFIKPYAWCALFATAAFVLIALSYSYRTGFFQRFIYRIKNED